MKKLLRTVMIALLCTALTALTAAADGMPAAVQEYFAREETGECKAFVFSRGTCIALSELPDGTCCVCAFVDFGESGYALFEQSQPLGGMDGVKPSLEATSDGFVLRFAEKAAYHFREIRPREWMLSRVEAPDAEQGYTCNAWLLRSYDGECAVYVHNASALLRQFDPADFPADFAAAVALKDSSDCALVCNPDPNDRLHLRAQPRRDAISKGRFYNGTPVKVLEIDGEWAHVQLDDHNEGYMMAKYLAVGAEAMLSAGYYRPAYTLRTEALEAGVTVYSRASADTVVRGTVQGGADYADADRVAGYINEDWFYVQFNSGLSGYVMADAYMEGNG